MILKPHMGLLFFAHAGRSGTDMAALVREKLMALSEPLLEGLGYELVDLEYAPGRAHAVVRVFIDQPAGGRGRRLRARQP